MLDSAFYRGEALCEFKYLIRDGDNKVALAVMLQGHTVKIFVQVVEGSRDSAKKMAEELMNPTVGKRVWFDLAKISSQYKELPVKGFNQYSGIAFYRCKKIDQSSPVKLVELFASYARTIRKAKNAIRSQIDAACKAD